MNKPKITEQLNINQDSLNAYSTGLLQGKAYRALSFHLTRTLLPHNLSIPEWKLLGQLYEKNNIRLAELADLLSVEPPHVTALIDMLEKKQLVKRVNDTYDKRAKVISVSPQGVKVIKITEPKVKLAMANLLKGTNSSELKAYVRVLAAIVNNSRLKM